MIPGYKKFTLPPLATTATPATKAAPTGNEVAEVAEVATPRDLKTWDHVLFDDPEERAAIYEFDAGMSRAEAERRAGLLN